MNTLLFEEEVYQIHTNDNISARVMAKKGMLKWSWKYGGLRLADKIIFRINTCPHCGSLNSFHWRNNQPDNHLVDNVYRVYIANTKKSLLVHKIDYCLDCHKEFSIEMFGWEKLSLLSFIKAKLTK